MTTKDNVLNLFSAECRSGCCQSDTMKRVLNSRKRIKKRLRNVNNQRKQFNKMSIRGKSMFVAASSATADRTENNHHAIKNTYLYPFTSDPYATTVLCSPCLQQHLNADNEAWTVLTEKSNAVALTQDVTRFVTAMTHIAHTKQNDVPAIVFTKQQLSTFAEVMQLKYPQYNDNNTSRDGVIFYSHQVVLNGQTISLTHRTSNISPKKGNYAVIVSKTDLDKCITESKNKVKVKYIYAYTGKPLTVEEGSPRHDLFVLLSLSVKLKPNKCDFSPNDGMHRLLRNMKNNILDTINHYQSLGEYFGHGMHASFERGQSVGPYASKQTTLQCQEQYDSAVTRVLSLVSTASQTLAKSAKCNVMEASYVNALLNKNAAEALNGLSHTVGTSNAVQLSPLCHKSKSLNITALNICVNASTKKYHTEDDQTYTLIIKPHQEECSSKRGAFMYKVNNQRKLWTSMNEPIATLFNARFTVHRQKLTHRDQHSLFWNIGCYSNRRFDQHTCALLRKEFHKVLGDLGKIFHD